MDNSFAHSERSRKRFKQLLQAKLEAYVAPFDNMKIEDIPPEMIATITRHAKQAEIKYIREVIAWRRELEEAIPELKKNPKVPRMLFITVRPRIDISFDDFKKQVQIFIENNRKFVGGEYAFEQKGEDENSLGHGFHVHILTQMTTTTRRQEVLSFAKSTFKLMCAQPDVKQVFNALDIANKRDYIRDAKSDNAAKHLAHEMDHLWRDQNGIDDIYTFGEFPEFSD